MGTVLWVGHENVPRDFQGSTQELWTPLNNVVLLPGVTVSQDDPKNFHGSQGSIGYKEKTTLPTSRVNVSRFTCVTACVQSVLPPAKLPPTEFRNINLIPFRPIRFFNIGNPCE